MCEADAPAELAIPLPPSPACILDAILTIEAHVPSVCPHRILQQAGGPK